MKPADSIDPTGVYEALSHRRAAHRAILIVCASDESELEKPEMYAAQEVAREHGVGLIKVVGDPGSYDSWETLETADRVEPDPIRANRFIEQQLGDLHEPLRDHLGASMDEVIAEVRSRLGN